MNIKKATTGKSHKIIIISDTHRHSENICTVLDKHFNADCIFYLGDGLVDMEYVSSLYPGKAVLSVAGNCDALFSGNTEREIMTEISGYRILLIHGDTLGVKGGLSRAAAYARAKRADILLFGHTHVPFLQYLPETEDLKALYMFNPGSLGKPLSGKPTYGTLEIRENGILFNHVNL